MWRNDACVSRALTLPAPDNIRGQYRHIHHTSLLRQPAPILQSLSFVGLGLRLLARPFPFPSPPSSLSLSLGLRLLRLGGLALRDDRRFNLRGGERDREREEPDEESESESESDDESLSDAESEPESEEVLPLRNGERRKCQWWAWTSEIRRSDASKDDCHLPTASPRRLFLCLLVSLALSLLLLQNLVRETLPPGVGPSVVTRGSA